MTQPIDINTKTPKTRAQEAVERYGINLKGVARGLALDYSKVRRAINPDYFRRVPFADVLRVRVRVGALIEASGYEGDVTELWAEYDRMIDMAA